jgi:hypothetical protein
LAKSRGFKIQHVAELANTSTPNTAGSLNLAKGPAADAGNFTRIFDDYFENMRPTVGDYKALELRWGTEIPVYPNTSENSNMFDYLASVRDPFNFRHVVYHPAHPAESDFVRLGGLKQRFNNLHLELGSHPRYKLLIDLENAKGLVREHLKDNPYHNIEYFSSLSEGD